MFPIEVKDGLCTDILKSDARNAKLLKSRVKQHNPKLKLALLQRPHTERRVPRPFFEKGLCDNVTLVCESFVIEQ